MKTLLHLLLITFFTSEIMVFNFNKNADINKWLITNDDVMGGLSTSKMTLNTEGNGVFSGTVSLDNNGGFAMTRLPVDLMIDDKKSKIVIKLKGDGKMYQFRIKSSKNQRYWYIQTFQTTTSWQTIELPLNSFFPSFRGNKLNKDNFSSNTIKEIAILVGNKKNEAFKLEIEKIVLK
ncbi:CIA30 family protein [Tenacibaculum todarodis]|uniref:CIA30 family protein n=1 Tax=Tenacibaculum todarodis TaxID=1850252 RepID=A0A1L3JK64_9FLAO|nr:CIA30 family protein [Tenacibaculum todarodis]APG65499.1 CIA30 family protein [Tenacibaculum todarodis]